MATLRLPRPLYSGDREPKVTATYHHASRVDRAARMHLTFLAIHGVYLTVAWVRNPRTGLSIEMTDLVGQISGPQ